MNFQLWAESGVMVYQNLKTINWTWFDKFGLNNKPT